MQGGWGRCNLPHKILFFAGYGGRATIAGEENMLGGHAALQTSRLRTSYLT
jgi:hypothetical protein